MTVDIKKILFVLVAAFFSLNDCVHCMSYGRIWSNATEQEIADLRARRTDLGVVLGHPEAALGNLLCVDTHPDATLVDIVYCSGSTPYSVDPPDATLARRTMLNLLLTNAQAADLAYGHRIRVLPEGAALNVMIGEALEAGISDEFRTILEDFTDRAGNFDVLIDKVGVHYLALLHLYNQGLTTYQARQTQRWHGIDSWGATSSTHTEIMFLDDILRLRGFGASQNLDGFAADQGAPIAIPRCIFSTKKMCETCERAIVRACSSSAPLIFTVIWQHAGLDAHHTPASNVRKICIQ